LSFFGVEGAYGNLWAPKALDCFALIDVDRRATTSLAMTCFVVSASSRSAKGAVAIHCRRQQFNAEGTYWLIQSSRPCRTRKM